MASRGSARKALRRNPTVGKILSHQLAPALSLTPLELAMEEEASAAALGAREGSGWRVGGPGSSMRAVVKL